jgi:hypothetical protein
LRAPWVDPITTNVHTIDELLGALPEPVGDLIHTAMFEDDAQMAAALRVLATIGETQWHDHVGPVGVDWAPILTWARTRPGGPCNSYRVRYEIAASLAGHPGAHVQLRYAAIVMERHSYNAVLDALRIAVEGVKP